MMTREDKLYSMKGDMLIKEADKLGVKVACNKNRTQLKESKQNVIDRILAFEASQIREVEEDVTVEHKLVPMPGIEKLEELKKEYSHEEDVSVDEVVETVVDSKLDKSTTNVKSDGKTSKNERANVIRDYLRSKSINYKERFYAGERLKCIAIFRDKQKLVEIYPQKKSMAIYVSKLIDLTDIPTTHSDYFLCQRVDAVDTDLLGNIIERLNL